MSDGGIPTTPVFFEGLLQVVTGVSDLYLLYDAPDCVLERTENVVAQHDLQSKLLDGSGHPRAFSSGLLERDLVFGTEERLRAAVRALAGRTAPSLLLMARSSLPMISGTDAEAIARELEAETGLQIAVVDSAPLSGCLLDGFARASEAIARRLPLPSPSSEPSGVALIGYPITRLEPDERANIAEIRRMCAALALDVRSLWFEGGSVSDLAGVSQAACILGLPWGGSAAATLGTRVERPMLVLDPPIGLDGTARWIRALGQELDRVQEAEAFITRELDEAIPILEWALPRGLLHRRVALAGDPHLAGALVAYLAELGMQVRAVMLHCRTAHSAEPVQLALERVGQSAAVLIDPSFAAVERQLADLHCSGELDLVIGTNNERDAVSPGVPYLELGYPSFVRHALHPAPWWGFRGALWLADAMFNLIAAAECRRC